MGSLVAENWETPVGGYVDNYFYTESSKIDQNVLMSLLDDPQNEDCDDERLINVIRSLEAEIAPNSSNCYSFNNMKWENDPFECESTSDESINNKDFSTFQDLDFEWMDLEMVPSSPSGGVESLYMELYGEEIGGEMGFGGMTNYAQHSYGNIPLMEEDDYGFLWQETNIS